MANNVNPNIEILYTDSNGNRVQRKLQNAFIRGDGSIWGADHGPWPTGPGSLITVSIVPIGGNPTIKQISDQIHQAVTGVARTTP